MLASPLPLLRTASAIALLFVLAGPTAAQSAATDSAPATETEAAPAAEATTEAAPAAEPVAPDTVLATVNGEPITEADLAFAPGQPQAGADPMQERARRLATLIELRSIAAAAEADGLADEEFERRLRAVREQQLAAAYMRSRVDGQLTEENLRARYEREVANFNAPEEIRASHILVETEEEARAVIAELEGGADFAELAAERSTGPSGPNGGDLGYFGPGRMVPAFDEAARALEIDEVSSDPVETQFGFHVIKVTDKRTAEAPPFEAVQDQIRQIEGREREIAEVNRLREEAEVEIVDETLRAAMDPAPGAENAAEGDAAAAPAAPGDAGNDNAAPSDGTADDSASETPGEGDAAPAAQ